MSIFQCDECGCADNTATGWYNSKNSKRICPVEILGKALCCVCAPTKYKSGELIKKFNNTWHNKFKRHFLPMNSFFINSVGNLEHIDTGLVGNELYDKFGKDESYKLINKE